MPLMLNCSIKLRGIMKNQGSLFLCLLIAFIFLAVPSPSYSLFVPASGQQTFTYTATVSPEVSGTPSMSKPLGVGTVAAGGDALDIHVMFEQFNGPVDIYLAVYMPALSPEIWMIKSDQSMVPLSSEFPKWKEGISADADESIWRNIPVNLLPDGDYFLGVLVSPSGSLDSYYFWITSFNLYKGSSAYSLLQGKWYLNLNETVWIGGAETLPQYGGSYVIFTGNNCTSVLIRNGSIEENSSATFFVSGNTITFPSRNDTETFTLSNNNSKLSLSQIKTGGTETNVLDKAPGPTPPVCTDYTYTAWSPCPPDGTETRTVISSFPAGCSGGAAPVTSQVCTYLPPTCSSFTYSAWEPCQVNGTQTRTVVSSSPSGCAGGSPVTSQVCTYTPPTPGNCEQVSLGNSYVKVVNSGNTMIEVYFGTSVAFGADIGPGACNLVGIQIPSNYTLQADVEITQCTPDGSGRCGALYGTTKYVPLTLQQGQTKTITVGSSFFN